MWLFDSNHRVYPKGGVGGGPIFREYFIPRKIIGETRVSWVLDDDRKVSKKELQTKGGYGLSSNVFTSKEQIDDECWVQDERHRVVRAVQSCRDANTLRKIDALIKELIA